MSTDDDEEKKFEKRRAAHDEMLEALRAIRAKVLPEGRRSLSIVAAGVRNLAQPVLLEGEEKRVEDLVDVARRLVELADAIDSSERAVQLIPREPFDPAKHVGLCPDCFVPLPADGSCCDECGWLLAPDGRRRRSARPTIVVLGERERRAKGRAR